MTQKKQVVAALVEGNSIRSTVRLTGVSKNTVIKLLLDLADACAAYHDANVRNLKVRRLQCDEMWQYVGSKAKNTRPEKKAIGWGDVWTWTALDADTKLCVSYLVGADIDYAQLQKIYGASMENETRYSPARCIGCDMKTVSGNPDPKHVSTSFVERQNLSMRMSIRRFTRLTNAFAKKIENHAAAVALWFTYYNFCRVHQTLRVTPAMEAGLSAHVWSIEEMCGLLPEAPSAVLKLAVR
jgi:IS1 family transposase